VKLVTQPVQDVKVLVLNCVLNVILEVNLKMVYVHVNLVPVGMELNVSLVIFLALLVLDLLLMNVHLVKLMLEDTNLVLHVIVKEVIQN